MSSCDNRYLTFQAFSIPPLLNICLFVIFILCHIFVNNLLFYLYCRELYIGNFGFLYHLHYQKPFPFDELSQCNIHRTKFTMSSFTGTIVVTLLIAGLFLYYNPMLLKYLFTYSFQIIHMMYTDLDRHLNVTKLQAETEWRLHQFEMQFNKEHCKMQPPSRGPVSWLTAMTNDDFVIGAVLNAYMIKRLSCENAMIALVSEGVSEAGKVALTKAGYEVKVVEPMDCNWMDRKKGRKERNLGIIGTHMRFHAWLYTKYKKLVYFDADIVPLTSIDEIFDLDTDFAAAYCGKPGVLDPCFNAGLLVFKPSEKDYKDIMSMWSSLSERGCPNDQVLLWHHYADTGRWTPLPYAYNVRREIYHPMKVYHFACCLTPKAWRVMIPPSRTEVQNFKGPLSKPTDIITLWWKYFYNALDDFQLNDWWKNASKSIRRKDH